MKKLVYLLSAVAVVSTGTGAAVIAGGHANEIQQNNNHKSILKAGNLKRFIIKASMEEDGRTMDITAVHGHKFSQSDFTISDKAHPNLKITKYDDNTKQITLSETIFSSDTQLILGYTPDKTTYIVDTQFAPTQYLVSAAMLNDGVTMNVKLTAGQSYKTEDFSVEDNNKSLKVVSFNAGNSTITLSGKVNNADKSLFLTYKVDGEKVQVDTSKAPSPVFNSAKLDETGWDIIVDIQGKPKYEVTDFLVTAGDKVVKIDYIGQGVSDGHLVLERGFTNKESDLVITYLKDGSTMNVDTSAAPDPTLTAATIAADGKTISLTLTDYWTVHAFDFTVTNKDGKVLNIENSFKNSTIILKEAVQKGTVITITVDTDFSSVTITA